MPWWRSRSPAIPRSPRATTTATTRSLAWDAIARDAAPSDPGSGSGSTGWPRTRTTSRRCGALGVVEARSGAVRRGRRELRVSDYSKNELMIARARGCSPVSRTASSAGCRTSSATSRSARSPRAQLVYESGVFGARPRRLPLSIGDPTLATGSTAVTSMFELFAFYLQAGLIDVAFLGGAQIDRFGNLNTTVIGDYAQLEGAPRLRRRLRDRDPRSEDPRHHAPGGTRSFVEKLHFRTSPGHSGDPAHDPRAAGPGAAHERRDRPRDLRLRRGDGRDDLAHDAPGRASRGRAREHGGSLASHRIWDASAPTADEPAPVRSSTQPHLHEVA